MSQIVVAKKGASFLAKNKNTLILGAGVLGALAIGTFLVIRTITKTKEAVTNIPSTIVNFTTGAIGGVAGAAADVAGKAIDAANDKLVENAEKTTNQFDDAIVTQTDPITGETKGDLGNALLYTANPIVGLLWASGKKKREEAARAKWIAEQNELAKANLERERLRQIEIEKSGLAAQLAGGGLQPFFFKPILGDREV